MCALFKALPAIYANARSECPRCWRRPSARKRGRSTLHNYGITSDLPVATFPVPVLQARRQALLSCDVGQDAEVKLPVRRSWTCDGKAAGASASVAIGQRRDEGVADFGSSEAENATVRNVLTFVALRPGTAISETSQ